MSKKYAIVVDVSPSEQLGDNEREIKVMSILFGLRSRESFDQVGVNAPDKNKVLELKKWSKSSSKYKRLLVEHLHYLKTKEHVLFGVNIVNDKEIRHVGTKLLKTAFGTIPKPSSYNRKGKPRVELGGYQVDGKIKEKYEILWDEMLILGWYADALISIYKMLVEVNDSEDILLDVLIDKLPLDVDVRKAEVLKMICLKMTNNKLMIAGVPEKSDFLQRDLLVDNIAGLNRELIKAKNPELYGKIIEIFNPNRVSIR